MSLRRTVHITYEEGIILENNGYELGPLDHAYAYACCLLVADNPTHHSW